MGPKKGKKNRKDKDEDEFPNEQKVVSKWAQALEETQQNEEQHKAEELYIKTTKTAFTYDFSNQRALDLMEQPIKVNRDPLQDLSPEQLEQLKKLKQKAKADKQVKNQIKNEKKKERKKQKQAEKAKEEMEKKKDEEDMKKVQQELQKRKKSEGSPWLIPLLLLLFLIFMFFLQYKKQIHQRLSRIKKSDDDFYDVLEADQATTDKQLKNKYKKLVLKYHPDRNSDCQNCKQKFDKIMKAWQVLGDPQKRKQYDHSSGFVSDLKSESKTLTPQNYHYLVEQSKGLWLIQVFDSTNQYSRYFSQIWQQLIGNYGDIIHFGRIDVWHQSDMLSYIPYKFQIFPSVYFIDQGFSDVCTFNFQSPMQGIKKCIEDAYNIKNQNLVDQIPEKSESNKIDVYLDGRLRANLRVKAYNKKFEQHMNFFYLNKEGAKREATVLFNDKKYSFPFSENSRTTFNSYGLFLQTFFVQEVSMCYFLQQCQSKQCLLILNNTKKEQIKKQLPLNGKQGKFYPIYLLTDEGAQLEAGVEKIKQTYEAFSMGLFEDGRIDLGDAQQAEFLNIQQGETIELECKVYSWTDRLRDYYEKINLIFHG